MWYSLVVNNVFLLLLVVICIRPNILLVRLIRLEKPIQTIKGLVLVHHSYWKYKTQFSQICRFDLDSTQISNMISESILYILLDFLHLPRFKLIAPEREGVLEIPPSLRSTPSCVIWIAFAATSNTFILLSVKG